MELAAVNAPAVSISMDLRLILQAEMEHRMIGTIDITIQAQNPEAPLYPLKAFVGSPSSIRVRNAPRRIGDWHLTKVYISAVYPDGQTETVQCVPTGGVWVGTLAGSSAAGTT